MNTAVAPLDALHTPVVPLADLAGSAREYAAASRAANTLRAYRSDWNHFEAWVTAQRLVALPAPPQTVALYVAAYAATLKPTTLARRLSAIGQIHQAAGHPDPSADATVRAVFKGVRRRHGVAPERKAPLVVEDLRRVVAAIDRTTLCGARDAALLLLGFATAMRRSELVALTAEDLRFCAAGMVVTLRRSKTDQEGAGRAVSVPRGKDPATCVLTAIKGWMTAAGIATGPLFRGIDQHGHVSARLTSQSVALIVQRRVAAAGLDPSLFAGHSLRAGFATSAAAVKVPEQNIAKVTGHQSMAVLRVYIRDGEMFSDHPLEAIGL